MTGTVLVLGSTGLFGSRAAQAFAQAGWQVRRFRRGDDMTASARGADVIVNALNPPMYHDWARLVPAITAEVIAAAEASGATILVPGNVYVYGDQPAPWGPQTPHRPITRKGAIRAEMEAAYRRARAQVIILRGGDFMDAGAPGSILNMVVLKGLSKGRITAMGAPGVARAHAWLPDMARAAAALAALRARLPKFNDIPFAGHAFSVDDLAAEIARHTGQRPRVVPFAWWQIHLAAPFWELARELREMRYLYNTPHTLDPAPLAALLPGLESEAFSTIVRAHLAAREAEPQGVPARG